MANDSLLTNSEFPASDEFANQKPCEKVGSWQHLPSIVCTWFQMRKFPIQFNFIKLITLTNIFTHETHSI